MIQPTSPIFPPKTALRFSLLSVPSENIQIGNHRRPRNCYYAVNEWDSPKKLWRYCRINHYREKGMEVTLVYFELDRENGIVGYCVSLVGKVTVIESNS